VETTKVTRSSFISFIAGASRVALGHFSSTRGFRNNHGKLPRAFNRTALLDGVAAIRGNNVGAGYDDLKALIISKVD
jgi:hypothetical protein